MLAFQLPLTKKSDATQVAAPLWHPNFRNYERLPDTKVVRTTFFINAASIVVALLLLLFVGLREFHIRELGQQIAEAQGEIDQNQKQNDEAIRLSGVFAEEERKLADAEAFARMPLAPSEYVLQLGRTLPKEIQVESADMRLAEPNSALCILRGFVAGTKDQASGTVSRYLDTLRATPKFAAVFETVSLTSLTADARSNLLSFEIVLKFKVSGKQKKP
jgi:hypothetical protein